MIQEPKLKHCQHKILAGIRLVRVLWSSAGWSRENG